MSKTEHIEMYEVQDESVGGDSKPQKRVTLPPHSGYETTIDSEFKESSAKRSSKLPKRHEYMRIAKHATQDFGEYSFDCDLEMKLSNLIS